MGAFDDLMAETGQAPVSPVKKTALQLLMEETGQASSSDVPQSVAPSPAGDKPPADPSWLDTFGATIKQGWAGAADLAAKFNTPIQIADMLGAGLAQKEQAYTQGVRERADQTIQAKVDALADHGLSKTARGLIRGAEATIPLLSVSDYLTGKQSDFPEAVALAGTKAVGSMLNPKDVGLMAMGGGPAEVIGGKLFGGAAKALGEVASEATSPALKAAFSTAAESLPRVGGSAVLAAPIGSAQAIAENPNAGFGELAAAAGKNVLLDTALNLAGSTFGLGSKVVGSYKTQIDSAAEQIARENRVLDSARVFDPKLGVHDVNYRFNDDGGMSLYNRRTMENVGSVDPLAGVSISKPLDGADHAAIENALLKKLAFGQTDADMAQGFGNVRSLIENPSLRPEAPGFSFDEANAINANPGHFDQTLMGDVTMAHPGMGRAFGENRPVGPVLNDLLANRAPQGPSPITLDDSMMSLIGRASGPDATLPGRTNMGHPELSGDLTIANPSAFDFIRDPERSIPRDAAFNALDQTQVLTPEAAAALPFRTMPQVGQEPLKIPAQSVDRVAQEYQKIASHLGASERSDALAQVLEDAKANGGVIDPAALEAAVSRSPDVGGKNSLAEQAVNSVASGPDVGPPPVEFGQPVSPRSIPYVDKLLGFTTNIGGYLNTAYDKVVKVLRWENNFKNADLTAAARRFVPESQQAKAILSLATLGRDAAKQVDREMAQIGTVHLSLDNAIKDAAEQNVMAKRAQGISVDKDVELAQMKDLAYKARNEGTPQILDQYPALKQSFTEGWNAIDSGRERLKTAAPPHLHSLIDDMIGSYQNRTYARTFDKNWLDRVQTVDPEKWQAGLKFVHDRYRPSDPALATQWDANGGAEGKLKEIIGNYGGLPNQAGQMAILPRVSKELDQRRMLSDEAKGFWTKVKGLEDNKQNPNYDFRKTFDGYLGELKADGKVRDAEEVNKLFLAKKAENPFITDRKAAQLAFEDQSINPILRQLMGEVTDPALAMKITGSKIAHDLVTYDLVSNWTKDLATKGVLSPQAVGNLFSEIKNPDVSMALGLPAEASVYSSPHVKAIIDGLTDTKRSHPVITALQSIQGFGKATKVFSTKGIAKQWIAAPLMSLANGDAFYAMKNPSTFYSEILPETAHALRFARTGAKEDLTPMVEAALGLGVIPKGPIAGELHGIASDVRALNPSAESGIKNAAAGWLGYVGKIYGQADAAAMFSGWQIRMRKLAWAQGTAVTPEIMRQAANEVKDTYQNVDRAPTWAVNISKNPFTSSFISFNAEMARNGWNMGKTALSRFGEAKRQYGLAGEYEAAGNQAMAAAAKQSALRYTALGMEGIGAMAATVGVMQGIQSQLKHDNGITPEKDAAFRRTLYPASANSTLLYTNHDHKAKTVEYFDSGSAFPYDPLTRVGEAIARPASSDLEKAAYVTQSLADSFSPGPFGMGMLAKSFVQHASAAGLKDDWWHKAPEVASETLKDQFLPTQMRDFSKFFTDKNGMTPAKAAASNVGIDIREVSIPQRAFSLATEFSDSVSSLQKTIRRDLTPQVARSVKERKDFIPQYADQWTSSYQKMRQHVDDLRTWGMKDDEISSALKAQDATRNSFLIENLLAGRDLSLNRYLTETGFWEKAARR